MFEISKYYFSITVFETLNDNLQPVTALFVSIFFSSASLFLNLFETQRDLSFDQRNQKFYHKTSRFLDYSYYWLCCFNLPGVHTIQLRPLRQVMKGRGLAKNSWCRCSILFTDYPKRFTFEAWIIKHIPIPKQWSK